MDDKLFIACVTFFVIDLTFVGTTTYFVVKLVKRLLREKDLLEKVMEAIDNIKKDNRNFIEKG